MSIIKKNYKGIQLILYVYMYMKHMRFIEIFFSVGGFGTTASTDVLEKKIREPR